MQQLPLSWHWQADYSNQNYVPLTSQKQAVEQVLALPTAHHWGAVLTGAEGAGKTHLAHIWSRRTGAHMVTAEDLVFDESQTHIVVDALEQVSTEAQQVLFHTFNHLNSLPQRALLVVTSTPLNQLKLLPDLASRLKLLNQVELPLPSEAELKILMAKWAADRQLEIPAQVVNYLLTHTNRHPALLQGVLIAADTAALAQKRRITVPLVKQVLADLPQQG